MLILLRKDPGRVEPLSSIIQLWEMVKLRLDRPHNNGFVEQVSNRLRVTENNAQIHLMSVDLNKVFGHKST